MIWSTIQIERHLELFSVIFVAFCEIFLGPVCCFAVPIIIVNENE